MKIRKATKKDFGEIAEIIKNEYGKPPYNEKWTEENALKTVGYYFEIGKINVSIVDGKVVGFIIHSEEFYNKGINILIEELIVDSSFQGTGLGKELVKSIEDYARVKDANMVYFFSNKKSRAFTFYKMNGYIPNDDFVIMEKRLR